MEIEQVNDNLSFYWPSGDEFFELQKSLVFGTVSRSKKPAKERKEYYEEKGLNENASRFMKNNLGFGDRSIAEQFNLNLEYNNIPATYSLDFLSFSFMSPIESSTRYLKMDENAFEKFEHCQYQVNYDKYLNQCRFLLKLYDKAYSEFYGFYSDKFPIENIIWNKEDSEESIKKTYHSVIKSKTIDTIKIFLPMSILSNITVCINARALQDLIQRLVMINITWDNAYDPFLIPLVDYLQTNEKVKWLFTYLDSTINIASERIKNTDKRPQCKHDINPHNMVKSGNVTALYLTPDIHIPYNTMPRINRHDKLDINYCAAVYNFNISSSIAAFRDLNRHRNVIKNIITIPYPHLIVTNKDMNTHGMKFLKELKQYDLLNTKTLLGSESMPMGTVVNWTMFGNLCELSNIIELRTGKGGYWEYIQIARDMANCIGHDKNLFQFADMETDFNETLPNLNQEMKKINA